VGAERRVPTALTSSRISVRFGSERMTTARRPLDATMTRRLAKAASFCTPYSPDLRVPSASARCACTNRHSGLRAGTHHSSSSPYGERIFLERGFTTVRSVRGSLRLGRRRQYPGTDLTVVNPRFKKIRSPYGDEELWCVPALNPTWTIVQRSAPTPRGTRRSGADGVQKSRLRQPRVIVSVEGSSSRRSSAPTRTAR